jgi:hypothetical protein
MAGIILDRAKGAAMPTDQILLLLLIITLYGVPTAIAIRRKHGHVVLIALMSLMPLLFPVTVLWALKGKTRSGQ